MILLVIVLLFLRVLNTDNGNSETIDNNDSYISTLFSCKGKLHIHQAGVASSQMVE